MTSRRNLVIGWCLPHSFISGKTSPKLLSNVVDNVFWPDDKIQVGELDVVSLPNSYHGEHTHIISEIMLNIGVIKL